MNTKWTTENIPNQEGKVILVTGANSGLGFGTSVELAKKGAHVVMTARNLEKGKKALQELKSKDPNAKVDLMQLNLADFLRVKLDKRQWNFE